MQHRRLTCEWIATVDGQKMTKGLTRRGFLASATAAGGVRALPAIATRTAATPGGRRILTLVYDKSLGMMRAIERVVP